MAFETFVDTDGTVYEAADLITEVEGEQEFTTAKMEEGYEWYINYTNGSVSYQDLVNHFGTERYVNSLLGAFEA